MNNAWTRWWLVRHAPVPCPEGRIHGNLDLACDVSDVEDFQALARLIPANSVLVESGLVRCRQTAGALESAGLMLPPPEVESDLAEQDFGHWQGNSWLQLETAKDPALPEFWNDPAGTCPPGGESFAEMVGRVGGAMERINARHAGRDILAVCHAGTIRAALAIALDLPPAVALRFVVRPLSLSRLDHSPDGWRVEGVNWGPG